MKSEGKEETNGGRGRMLQVFLLKKNWNLRAAASGRKTGSEGGRIARNSNPQGGASRAQRNKSEELRIQRGAKRN